MQKSARNLSDEDIEAIAQKVLGKAKDEPDQEAGPVIMLLDEPESDSENKEASSRFADIEGTPREIELYKKEHETKPGTKFKIIKPQRGEGAPDPTDTEQQKKAPSELPEKQKQTKEPSESPPKQEFEIREKVEKKLGPEEAKNWNTHPVHIKQLEFSDVAIEFPDGSKKKYRDLDDAGKKQVQEAISSGNIAHKGMNDYTKTDISTFKKNMTNNLALYDDASITETKSTSKEKISKENVGEFTKKAKINLGTVLDKYASSMSDISRPMAQKFIDHALSCVEEGATKDGSLADVSQEDLEEHIREDVKRMISQEVETRGRSLGDHGIRHVASDADHAFSMLNQLQAAGNKDIKAKDKLMALSILANHDTGYMVGMTATTFKKEVTTPRGEKVKVVDHQQNSETLARSPEEVARYGRIFGKDSTDKIAKIIRTHDDCKNLDWEKEPVASAIRLSDSVSVFGEEKVQDLFLRDEEALGIVCKMRLAADAAPDDQDIQKKLKGQLHKRIDAGKYDAVDKEQLHKMADEMVEKTRDPSGELKGFSSSEDVLARISGRVNGVEYDKDKKVMKVNMTYTPDGQIVDQNFADHIALGRVGKMIREIGTSPSSGEKRRGEITLQNETTKKPTVLLSIDGYDKPPEDTAVSPAVKEYQNKTVRGAFSHMRKAFPPPPIEDVSVDDAYAYVKEPEHWAKFNDKEKESMEQLFTDKKSDPEKLLKELAHWPLLESEHAYLYEGMEEEKQASWRGNIMSTEHLVMASIATKSVFKKLAALSDEDKQKVLEKVQEKMSESGEEKEEEEPTSEESKEEVAPEETEEKDEEAAPEETEEKDEEAAPEESEETEDTEKEEVPAESEEEETEEPASEETEEVVPEESEETEMAPPSDGLENDEEEAPEQEDAGDDIKGIVDDLAKEISTIKEDGKVSTSEVIGLIKSMMEMVNLLVEAKAPARRKRRGSYDRIEAMTDNIVNASLLP